jgi:hypothetical protein
MAPFVGIALPGFKAANIRRNTSGWVKRMSKLQNEPFTLFMMCDVIVT